MRKHSFLIDTPFSVIIAALVVAGLFLLSSASVAVSAKKYGTIYFYSLRQLFAALLGLAALFIVHYIPYRFLRRLALPLFACSLILLALVFAPQIGLSLGGAQRWINLGMLSFQPSEIAKVAFVIFLAWWFDRIGSQKVRSFRFGFLPFLCFVGIMGGLILAEPDLGTFLVIAGSAVLMYIVAGGRWQYVLLFALIGAIAFGVLTQVKPYVGNRVDAFLNPEQDPLGIGYQVRQATISIGSGGVWGLGYGSSQQSSSFLPEPIGDSIFAIVAGEFGFLGVLIVLGLYLAFLWRGIIIARQAPDLFAKLLVAGIIGTITLQAFINMGAISGLLPLTGIPLPFISYGGTSLFMNLVSIGIIYQIAKQS